MLVELVAEEAVLLLKIIDGAAVLDCHLDAALDLELEKIYCLLSVTQLQLQCLLFYLQGLALTLSLFKPVKMLKRYFSLNSLKTERWLSPKNKK